jgi:two-component system phosphate regulon response regulator PhoB/two-component system alkaline phosphatase synthesis response regulator PhoP/two-component system response regulator VicR
MADILIIDDDRDLVNSIRVILESKDHKVRAAYNGKEGYAKIEEKAPRLILLDVMMATDTEGFDLAYKLRRNPAYREIPILMVSGFTQKMAEMGSEGFQHILGEEWPVSQFLEKPIDPEKLLAAVETLLK